VGLLPAQQPRMAIRAQNGSTMVFEVKRSYNFLHASRMPGLVDKHGAPLLSAAFRASAAAGALQGFCCCCRVLIPA
jgi:hypothetical protein